MDPDGRQAVAYAVVTLQKVLEAQPLPLGTASQKAELTALTRVLHLARNKRASIYTDSKYAFLIAYSHVAIWKDRGFLTTKGSPICNASHITKLLEPIPLPKEVAILHCRGHQAARDKIAQGNNLADQVAQQTALQREAAPLLVLETSFIPKYTKAETRVLLTQEGTQTHPSGWITLHEKLVLPEQQAITIIKQIHDTLHIGQQALLTFLSPLFSPLHLRPSRPYIAPV